MLNVSCPAAHLDSPQTLLTLLPNFPLTLFNSDLGRHSFALYLMHGPMIGILSERLFYLTGVKTNLGMTCFGMVLCCSYTAALIYVNRKRAARLAATGPVDDIGEKGDYSDSYKYNY